MCGIAGIVSPHADLINIGRLKRMADTLAHRGPDGEAYWVNEQGNVGFGHRRLAIIDLSEKAAQPFHYLHYTIIFNGEIFNYVELKQQLQQQQYHFTTSSDTEVILAAFDYWGYECLHYFDGMFAFAIWNNKTQQLFIARDRFGEKPLYYHASYVYRGRFEQFTFASEMKALWAAGVAKSLNGGMMLNYLTLGYTTNPIKKTETFYSNILSLPAGHYLTVQPQEGRLQMKKWYHPETAIQKKITTGTDEDIIEQFKQLLTTSVQRRLRCDVSFGCSLSGGLDSSAITALICGQPDHFINWKLKTFSAIFPDFEKDESVFINEMKHHFQLQSYMLTPSAEDLETHWLQLTHHQEEPLQSSSILIQYLVYQLAKEQGVTVLLDGQGADEIAGGYTRYTHWYLQHLLRTNPAAFLKERRQLKENHFLGNWGWRNYAAARFPGKVAVKLQQRAISQQNNHPYINRDFMEKYQNISSLQKPVVNQLDDILFYNTFHAGLEELLRYADRNSMAHSREIRLPFLYHELVEFIFALPVRFKINQGFTKWILRKSMDNVLPASIAWRKGKTGYEPPQQQWMNKPFIQEMIIAARKKLADAHVLNSNIIKTPVNASGAHATESFDWRYLSAAALL